MSWKRDINNKPDVFYFIANKVINCRKRISCIESIKRECIKIIF